MCNKTGRAIADPAFGLINTNFHPTFYVFPPLLEVFLEAELVLAAEPEVVLLVVEPEVVSVSVEAEVVLLVVEPEVVSVSVAVEPEVVVSVVESEVVSVAGLSREVAVSAVEPEVVFVAAEPQASVDIAVAFVVLIPVSVVVVEVDNRGHPRSLASPNVDHYATSSSSVEAAGEESVHSPTGARANHGLCNILSSQGLYQNKNLEHRDNSPNPGHNNANDTNDLPIDATTSHPRKTDLHLCLE